VSDQWSSVDKNLPMAVLRPTTLDDALAALAEHPGAHVLAGGTDFMVEVNFGHRRPDDVVALGGVDELRRSHIDVDTVRLGSGVTCTQLMQAPIADALPALAQAARTVGSPQIRNAATIGGNLGTGSPAGDLLPVLSALDAAVVVRSHGGSRVLSIHEFLVGPKRTALEPGELVTEAVIARPRGPQEFMKVGVRNAMVIAIANLALVVDHGALKVAAGSVGPTVIRARDAERWAEANGGTGAEPGEFGRRVAAEVRPIDDHRSTAEYRRHAVEVMAARALLRVAAA
jgi:CO/xanthine dehydrogenase FAD-binding subunit